jgi:hypothetical protein
MYAIAHHERGTGQKVASSPIHNSLDIQNWWTGTLPAARQKNVTDTLAEIRKDGMWIACSCTGNRQDPPLFSLGFIADKGTIYLSRMKERAPHKPGCIFEFDLRDGTPEEKDVTREGGNDEPTSPPSFLEEDEPTKLGKAPSVDKPGRLPGTRSKSAGIEPLARQLMWLLHRSGMQQWPMKGKSPAQMLLDTAKTLPLKQGLHLSDILYCKAKAWTDHWVDSALNACEREGLPAQAILICPVFDASREGSWVSFEAEGEHIPVNGQISIYGGDGAAARYPMLMYAKIMRSKGEPPRIAKAYLHPVLSTKQWMLVDSDYERKAFHAIESGCYVLDKRGIKCQIDKPVYNWGETEARPDFVITAHKGGKSHSLIVETMGTDDPDYTARKKETVARLSGFKVFEDLRYKNSPSADGNLVRFVIGYLLAKLDT